MTMRNKMKHIIVSMLLLLVSCSLLLLPVQAQVSAFKFPDAEEFFDQDRLERKDGSQGNQEETDPNRKELDTEGDEFTDESSRRASNIPTGDLLTEIFPKAIKIVFYIMGVVIFAAFLYIGVNLIISRGDEEALGLLKTQIIDVILGACVVGAALAMVSGIIRVLANL